MADKPTVQETFCGPQAAVVSIDVPQSQGQDDPAETSLLMGPPKPPASKPAVSPIPMLLGRPLLRTSDVPLILEQLQTTVATPDDFDGDPPAPLTAEEILKLATDGCLTTLRRSSAVKRVTEKVPALKIPAGEEDSQKEDTEAADAVAEAEAEESAASIAARFLSPTAVEDVFAQLSDFGAGVCFRRAEGESASPTHQGGRSGTGDEGDSGSGVPSHPTQQMLGEMDLATAAATRRHVFGNSACSLSDQELLQLHAIVGSRPRDDAQEQLDEELLYERWTMRSEEERRRGVNLARGFVDSDTAAYPHLKSPTAKSRGGLPWDQPPVQMGISDGTDIADFPLMQTSRETPDDFRKDLELLTGYQTKIALIDQRQADRKYDASRLQRHCRHSGPLVPASRAGGEEFSYAERLMRR
eukprot:TRINITY_DN19208_c0_g1_i1.p1 TRINITY_DN19208_c0_g1~~TRINITY_DN19208_c0_g1_i1.p1  ORF type:complete len:432 (+),score=162.97 TRINITY_DN19208_c0_g1_i1:58-1296(+)